jgi:hypothetical protein
MSPLFAHSLCFWLEIMCPTFISSYYALQKSIPFSLIMPQKFFTNIHMPFLQFWCEMSWHLPCTHTVIMQYIMHNIASTATANTKFQGNLITCNTMVFLYHSFTVLHCLWPVRGQCGRSASATLVTPFFSFLSHCTIVAVINKCLYIVFILLCISFGFTTSLLKKQITEHCSSLVKVSSGAAIFNYPNNIKHPVLPTFLFTGH